MRGWERGEKKKKRTSVGGQLGDVDFGAVVVLLRFLEVMVGQVMFFDCIPKQQSAGAERKKKRTISPEALITAERNARYAVLTTDGTDHPLRRLSAAVGALGRGGGHDRRERGKEEGNEGGEVGSARRTAREISEVLSTSARCVLAPPLA